VLFAIPWYDKVVIGTTDTPLDIISLEPKALDQEIEFILRTAGRYLTRPPERKDVKCIYAGLRPLAANPDNPAATKEVSRRHKITLSSSGLLSIIGGKWTSYRRMAEETIDRGIKSGILEKKKCITKSFSFYPDNKPLKEVRLQIYGSQANEIERMIADQPDLAELINPRLPYTKAEIVWICRNEFPRAIEDILARRTRALFMDVRASKDAAPEVAEIMAKELGFSKTWQESQILQYNELTINYI
jgi:glycerol-3-phosphate dehydrogenase